MMHSSRAGQRFVKRRLFKDLVFRAFGAFLVLLLVTGLSRLASLGQAPQAGTRQPLREPPRGTMVLAVISDEHNEFSPFTLQTDNALGGPVTPANIVNLVRARDPDLIVVTGDLGEYSTVAEYRGFWVQSTGAVTATGTSTTVDIDSNPSYTEFGLSPNTNAQVFGDLNLNPVAIGTWASVYDDITGANFEIVQITARTSSSVTAVFTKTHQAGFIMRAHAMSEYWDYVLAGKIAMVSGNHDDEMTAAFCGASPNPGCGGVGWQGPANIMTLFAPYGMFGGQTNKTYWAKKFNSLLSIVGIDSMANVYAGGDGITYGSVQEMALRPALNKPGLGSVWTITAQHHLPRNTCESYGVASFSLGSAVDAAFGGHEHVTQVMMAPQCIGSGCTSTKNIPVVDQSGYTWMTHDPVSGCIYSAGAGSRRLVLNGSSLNGGGAPAPQRTYGLLTVTAETLSFTMYDQHNNIVTDMTDPTSAATWTLTKASRRQIK